MMVGFFSFSSLCSSSSYLSPHSNLFLSFQLSRSVFFGLENWQDQRKTLHKKEIHFWSCKNKLFYSKSFFWGLWVGKTKKWTPQKTDFFSFFFFEGVHFLFCEIARPKKGLFENWTCKEWLFLVLLLFKKESIFRCCEFTNPKNGFLFFGYLALVIVFLSIALFIIIDKQCEIMKNNELFIYLLFITLFIVVLIIF